MTDNESARIKAICEIANIDDIEDLSDGYHTYKELYHQRAILFATIVNQNKGKAWKSWKHSDGNYCFDSNGEWFIVGVDTPEGSYIYHYSKEYWDYFHCKELECSKEWDGHTEKDVGRLLSLEQKVKGYTKFVPCRFCGKNSRVKWYGTNGITLECKGCGKKISGRNGNEAKINWNRLMGDF